MFNDRNEEIKKQIKESRFPMWFVAEKAGISEPTFTRWMRQELIGEKKTRILAAIEELKQENG